MSLRLWRAGFAFSISAALTSIGSAQVAKGRPLAIEDYYRIKTVGNPVMSPDGKWVAFTVSTRVEATNGNTSQVWLVPSDASAPERRASAENVNATDPRWLDDGRLVFSSDRQSLAIDPLHPDSTPQPSSPPMPTGRGGGRGGRRGPAPGTPISSSDGKATVTVRDTPLPPREKVYESDFARRHEERFKGIEFDWIEFQRDGAQFPLPNTADPYVFPPQETFLANGEGADTQLTHLGLRPEGTQWNRAGTMLVFTADSSYRDELVYGRSDIWTVAPNGTTKKLTSNKDYSYTDAAFSPDGEWILAVRSTPTDAVIAKKMDNGGPVDVVLVPANGGAEVNLTAAWDYLPSAPFWSADGRYIYFTGGIGGTTHLFRVSPKTKVIEQVTIGERRLSGFDYDRSLSKMVYLAGTFDALPEMFVSSIDGTGERQLTHVGGAFTREVALSHVERVNFKSADGTPVEGFLFYPYGYSSGNRDHSYPLIVSNHGGPHSANQYGFDFKNQYFAANGYFVLEVNFRSSTGYGEKFLWATWGAWGTKDGQDVMAGVDYVLAHYPVDRHKVAVIGHSYGGFMTNWLITQYPDRFAAAASGAGIANWTSDYANSDIPRTKETEFWGPPSDPNARATMIRQSPITYANRIRTPTLFINGEIDKRVPFSENEQLYVAIKKNGVPAKMIVYAGQPHAIAGAWNNVHRMLNERAWFDRYVKGDSAVQAGRRRTANDVGAERRR